MKHTLSILLLAFFCFQSVGQQPLFLSGHKGEVLCVACAANGNIASGGSDTKAILWDGLKRTQLRSFDAHAKSVSCLAISSTSTHLASGGFDGKLIIWNLTKRKKIAEMQDFNPLFLKIDISADSKKLAAGFVTEDGQDRVGIWEIENGKRLMVLDGAKDGILSVAFEPEGSLVAGGSVITNDVFLWDTRTGKKTGTLAGHSDAVLRISFSKSGRFLGSASQDRTFRIWDVRSKKTIFVGKYPFRVISVLFFPNENFVATLGCYDMKEGKLFFDIQIWDVLSKKAIAKITEGPSIYELCYNQSTQELVGACGDGRVRLWKLSKELAQKISQK